MCCIVLYKYRYPSRGRLGLVAKTTRGKWLVLVAGRFPSAAGMVVLPLGAGCTFQACWHAAARPRQRNSVT